MAGIVRDFLWMMTVTQSVWDENERFVRDLPLWKV